MSNPPCQLAGRIYLDEVVTSTSSTDLEKWRVFTFPQTLLRTVQKWENSLKSYVWLLSNKISINISFHFEPLSGL